jgi:Family of unknown function (DUF6171)
MSVYGLKEMARDMLSGNLKLSPDELKTERLKVCKECDQFKPVTKQCAVCGCFMDFKAKLAEADCPLHKW